MKLKNHHCHKLKSEISMNGKNRKSRVALFLVCSLLSAQSFAQKMTVTGTVISSTDNQPMIGVNVKVKGASGGSITDLNGNFRLQVQKGDELQLSYMGYSPQTVMVTGEKLQIVMKEVSSDLDEVVVIGYGVQKKKLVTGATAQLKGNDLAKMNTTNPLQAMQGQAPGINIASSSGQPGSDMKVTIRGLGTVGNSSPLYIIDGIRGDITTLNPADIESIDILKDAASAAIYGSQSANGVVLITTKSGKEGRTLVSFDGYYGLQYVPRTIELLNADQYKMILDEQALNSGKSVYDWNSYKSIYTTITDANGNIKQTPVNTDWIKQMFKKGAETQSYTVGVTGGSKAGNYALSLGYMSQEGLVGGKDVSNYERYNFRFNSDWKLFGDFLKIGEQVSFIYKKQRGIAVEGVYWNTLRSAFTAPPVLPVYGEGYNGSPYYDNSNSDFYNQITNPYGAMMTNSKNLSRNVTFAGNVYAELQPVKNLKLRTVLGVNYYSSDYREFKPLYKFSIYDYNTTRTSVKQSMSNGWGLTWTNTASYDWKIGKHAFNALLGMEVYQSDGMNVGAGNASLREGFNDWNHAYVNNGTATSQEDGLSATGNPNDSERMVSYFGRINWSYKDTYMLNATLRNDGSSKFARGHRFGWFPSVSAGWVISNEKFMESTVSWLDFLKIRASWGQVGNQSINPYMYDSPIKLDHTYYLFGTTTGSNAQSSYWGAYPSRLANASVTWETSEQYDFGFDTRFLHNRLSVNFDYYIKNTKDWLVVAPILATAGTSAPYINGGDVSNKGVELALSWNDKIGKDFHYYLSINGAYNKNKVGSIPTEDGIIHGTTNELYNNAPEFYRASNGQPIGYFWGYKTAGIFQNEEQIANWNKDGKHGILQTNPQPGDVIYIDQNGDGSIDEKDKVNLGNGMPKFTYGFSIGFDYKNFDFSVTANGVAGNKIVQAYRDPSSTYANYTTEILGRWTGEGTSNRLPRVTETNINWQFSDLYIHKGDFLRISNITLGYDFSKLINCKYISQARIYAQVQNAFTFTKYNGMDPEIGYGNTGWTSGVDYGYYPRPRTFLLGVNLKF